MTSFYKIAVVVSSDSGPKYEEYDFSSPVVVQDELAYWSNRTDVASVSLFAKMDHRWCLIAPRNFDVPNVTLGAEGVTNPVPSYMVSSSPS